ncbi:class I SAM-dependent methyltransferase (plasmid) [Cupriavidus oxalaticus]|uniref:Class I SAM-dependent methyltransferase n=2 Tax=Burkholderiaceae TaxID=119060 RepID=A0A5P3VU14_9BURK|nr:class I SAM-dependent methyltransferase [Cupriavidus oxalaticus]
MRICNQCKAPLKIDVWACTACGWQPRVLAGVLCLAPAMMVDHDGFHEPLFVEYEKLEATHFWFVYRRKLILDALQRYFPTLRSFMDVGCGTAENLRAIQARFPRARLVGGEASLRALMQGQRKCKAQLLQMDARAIPFAQAFDVLGAFDVIEHVDDDAQVLAEMYRACRNDGGIVLTVPQHPSLWSHMDDAAKHKRRYTRQELVKKVEAAGFEIVDVTSFMTLLLPAMAISRVWQRAKPPGDAMDDGFRIGAAMNGMLGGVCTLEHNLIRAGLRFPAGGSLLLVARKKGWTL